MVTPVKSHLACFNFLHPYFSHLWAKPTPSREIKRRQDSSLIQRQGWLVTKLTVRGIAVRELYCPPPPPPIQLPLLGKDSHQSTMHPPFQRKNEIGGKRAWRKLERQLNRDDSVFPPSKPSPISRYWFFRPILECGTIEYNSTRSLNGKEKESERWSPFLTDVFVSPHGGI